MFILVILTPDGLVERYPPVHSETEARAAAYNEMRLTGASWRVHPDSSLHVQRWISSAGHYLVIRPA